MRASANPVPKPVPEEGPKESTPDELTEAEVFSHLCKTKKAEEKIGRSACDVLKQFHATLKQHVSEMVLKGKSTEELKALNLSLPEHKETREKVWAATMRDCNKGRVTVKGGRKLVWPQAAFNRSYIAIIKQAKTFSDPEKVKKKRLKNQKHYEVKRKNKISSSGRQRLFIRSKQGASEENSDNDEDDMELPTEDNDSQEQARVPGEEVEVNSPARTKSLMAAPNSCAQKDSSSAAPAASPPERTVLNEQEPSEKCLECGAPVHPRSYKEFVSITKRTINKNSPFLCAAHLQDLFQDHAALADELFPPSRVCVPADNQSSEAGARTCANGALRKGVEAGTDKAATAAERGSDVAAVTFSATPVRGNARPLSTAASVPENPGEAASRQRTIGLAEEICTPAGGKASTNAGENGKHDGGQIGRASENKDSVSEVCGLDKGGKGKEKKRKLPRSGPDSDGVVAMESHGGSARAGPDVSLTQDREEQGPPKKRKENGRGTDSKTEQDADAAGNRDSGKPKEITGEGIVPAAGEVVGEVKGGKTLRKTQQNLRADAHKRGCPRVGCPGCLDPPPQPKCDIELDLQSEDAESFEHSNNDSDFNPASQASDDDEATESDDGDRSIGGKRKAGGGGMSDEAKGLLSKSKEIVATPKHPLINNAKAICLRLLRCDSVSQLKLDALTAAIAKYRVPGLTRNALQGLRASQLCIVLCLLAIEKKDVFVLGANPETEPVAPGTIYVK